MDTEQMSLGVARDLPKVTATGSFMQTAKRHWALTIQLEVPGRTQPCTVARSMFPTRAVPCWRPRSPRDGVEHSSKTYLACGRQTRSPLMLKV